MIYDEFLKLNTESSNIILIFHDIFQQKSTLEQLHLPY